MPAQRRRQPRMAGVEQGRHGLAEAVLAAPPQVAHRVQEGDAHAGALPFRHDHQPTRPRLAQAGPRGHGDMRHRRAVDEGDVARRGDHLGQAQIVMRRKKRPPFPSGFVDVQVDGGTSKTPPGPALPGRRVQDPVRPEPFDDVVVTRQEHGASAGAPPRLGERHGADPGDLPVDHAGELVDHHPVGRRAYDPRQVGAEALARGQHGIGPQPRRHAAQAHGRQRVHDPVERLIRSDDVDDRPVRRPRAAGVQGVRPPDAPADAGLARPGRTDDQPDRPIVALDGDIDGRSEIGAGIDVEQAFHAGGTVRLGLPAPVVDGDLHVVTTLQAWPCAVSASYTFA